MSPKKKLVGIATITASLVGITGVAFAVWSVSGSGSGSASATIAQSLTITAVTPTGAQASLYPGGPAGPVELQVSNPNPYAVTITGLTWGSPYSNSTSSCASANLSIDTGAPKTVSISVAANASAQLVTENGVLDLSHSAPDGCQGVSFTVPVSVSGSQQ